MTTVFTDSTHAAAKRYQCYYCGQPIEKGESYGRRTGVSYGDFWTMHYHPECDDYAVEHWDEGDWECHCTGDFERPMTAFDPVI